MTSDTTGKSRFVGALSRFVRLEGVRQRWRRAREHPGHERDRALMLAKGALAGVVAWVLAEDVLDSPQPTYAPFVALLVVQSTVYRSLLHSAQYVAAALAGVLASAVANPLLGQNVGAFAVMLVVGLLMGSWRQLGTMGLQAPIAGIFAFNALLLDPGASTVGSIVAMVLLGAGVGLLVNLLLLPPMRYRSADEGVAELSTAMRLLLCDMAEGTREGTLTREDADDWLRRARELSSTVTKARGAVESGAESVNYNPRRWLPSRHHRSPTFSGYRLMIEALAHAGEQLRSIASGLSNVLAQQPADQPEKEFLRSYSLLLEHVAEGVRRVGGTGSDDTSAGEELQRVIEAGDERRRQLAGLVGGSSLWPTLGALLADAGRILQDMRGAHEQGALRAD